MSLRRGLVTVAAFALLTAASTAPAGATFGGANGRILFHRYIEATNSQEIFSAGPDGNDVTQLTFNGQDHFSTFADWSPDGQRIAFDSDRVDQDGRDDVVQIYVMPWNGESHGLRQLTVGPGFHGDPAWSPNGKRIAIEADWGHFPAAQGIWTIPSWDANGVTRSEARRVTRTPNDRTFDSEPQFSPDGRWIVFTRFRFVAEQQAIFKVRSDGSHLTRLTNWTSGYSAPDWSPNGKRIAFDSGDLGRIGDKGDIWVMDADGSHKTRLTDTPRITATRFRIANNPSWSPDGRRIAFSQWIDGGFPVWLVSIARDGSDRVVLVDGEFFQNKVDWGTHP